MPVVRHQDGGAARRRTAPAGAVPLAVVSLMAALVAACGSNPSPSGGTGAGTTAAGQPLAPFVGTLTTVALPAGVQSLQDVDCPSATRCWAVGTTLATPTAPAGGVVVTTTTGGARWSVQTLPPTVGYLTAIACPTTRSCTAVGQVGATGAGPGAVLTTSDAGSHWVLQATPAGTADVTAVACPPAGPCTALGNVAGRVTTLAPGPPGAPWVARGALPATVSSATGLSCTSARRCWATVLSPVDPGHAAGGVAATADAGATWTLQAVPAGTGALQGIDCTPAPAPGASSTTGTPVVAVDCTAVGTTSTTTGVSRAGQGLLLTTATGGATWATAPVPATASAAALLAVSCGAGPCVAVGATAPTAPEPGLALLADAGDASGWRRAAVADTPLPLTGVSCRSLTACVVVGESVSAHLSTG